MKNKKRLTVMLSIVIVLCFGLGIKNFTSPKYKVKKVANAYMKSLKKGSAETLLLANDVKNSLNANWINDYKLTDYEYSTAGENDMGIVTYKIDINGETKMVKLVVDDKETKNDFLITFIVPM